MNVNIMKKLFSLMRETLLPLLPFCFQAVSLHTKGFDKTASPAVIISKLPIIEPKYCLLVLSAANYKFRLRLASAVFLYAIVFVIICLWLQKLRLSLFKH
jgi:hypothetical protein